MVGGKVAQAALRRPAGKIPPPRTHSSKHWQQGTPTALTRSAPTPMPTHNPRFLKPEGAGIPLRRAASQSRESATGPLPERRGRVRASHAPTTAPSSTAEARREHSLGKQLHADQLHERGL